jgi:murein DD-endopeptidase MepM/ murein hydrolase activator NlpD
MPIQSQLLLQLFRWMMSFLILCFIFFPSFSLGQGNPFFKWNILYPKIRDRLISKEEAQGKLKALELSIRETTSQGLLMGQEDRLCFPLKGYTFHSIGGTKGSGYQIQGYDFFDGSQHKGHPGHDIFIQDKDQDGVDDRTGNPVDVLSVCSGVVVSVHGDWEPLSPIRGGNYVWVYNPIKGRYFYYAHLREIAVSVGQIASRGDRLGAVGRTGLNAYPKRSPTHLHFSVHQSIDGYPRPMDPYFDLVRAEVR